MRSHEHASNSLSTSQADPGGVAGPGRCGGDRLRPDAAATAGQPTRRDRRASQPVVVPAQGPGVTLERRSGLDQLAGPIRLEDLHGKIVLLDFWTYCCINCHHVLPDLANLEEKYKNELVVIGVHSAKFDAEQDTENIRQKVREYGIKHPVINDANQDLWNRFGVQSWPTLVLIDPDGRYVGRSAGEGHYEVLDKVIGKLVAEHKARKRAQRDPVAVLRRERPEPDDGPLLFPGKVLADARLKRLFISDTGHNRIVMTDLHGEHP